MGGCVGGWVGGWAGGSEGGSAGELGRWAPLATRQHSLTCQRGGVLSILCFSLSARRCTPCAGMSLSPVPTFAAASLRPFTIRSKPWANAKRTAPRRKRVVGYGCCLSCYISSSSPKSSPWSQDSLQSPWSRRRPHKNKTNQSDKPYHS